MVRNVGHKQLIEGVESARDARGQADEPDEHFLIGPELAHMREKIVKIQLFLIVTSLNQSKK